MIGYAPVGGRIEAQVKFGDILGHAILWLIIIVGCVKLNVETECLTTVGVLSFLNSAYRPVFSSLFVCTVTKLV
jgi:hypothetical protein